jgi:hypothetical protein
VGSNERTERNKLYVRFLKLRSRCTDCGTKEDLTFDHLPGFTKLEDIASMVHHGSLKKLKREMAKCEIVCIRCHRVRENERGRAQHKIE